MTVPVEVLTLAGRIATFQQTHQASKRRTSNVKKKATTSISWPHGSPLPEEFARAGFFYRPTADAPDNVQCFNCLRQLDGWEPHDDPVLEHITHVPDCGWAINVCIGQRCAADPDNIVEEDPMNARLLDARAKTFEAGSGWPHEDRKGWKCKVKKMVEAGWCYDPSPEADDGVTCFYCKLSLDGWEPKDDPLVEHRKRSADCPFFALLEQYAELHKQPPRKKPRSSRASRVSRASARLSTQSDMFPEEATLASVVDAPTQLDDSVLSAGTTTSKAGKRKGTAKSKAAPKTSKKTTRRKKADEEAESQSSILYPALTTSTEMQMDVSQLDVTQISAGPPKRSTRARANTVDTSLSTIFFVEKDPPPTRATRTRGTKKKNKESILSEDASQLHSELQAAIDLSLGSIVPEHESTPKAERRGTKRTSDGKGKLDSSVIISGEAVRPRKQAARTKKGTKKANESEDAHPRSSVSSSAGTQPLTAENSHGKSRPASKSEKGKKPQKKAAAEPESVHTQAQVDAVMLDDFPAPPAQNSLQAKIRQSPSSMYDGRQPPAGSPSPAPSTPTPMKSSNVILSASRPIPDMRAARATPTPGSPNSDAENAPPSSIAPSARPPLSALSANKQVVQVPLSNTPTSKDNGLRSSMAWSAVDLENIFVPSPGSKPVVSPLTVLERMHENVERIEMTKLKDVMRSVQEGLSGEEKTMTVSEWIIWNAAKGEQNLRAECERLVTIFENEGVRALGILEGIEAVS